MRTLARVKRDDPAPLAEGEMPLLEIVANRSIRRVTATDTRLQVFVRVLAETSTDYEVRFSLRPMDGGAATAITHQVSPPTSAWDPHSVVTVDVPLAAGPGEYHVHVTFAEPSGACLRSRDGSCRVSLGVHRVWD